MVISHARGHGCVHREDRPEHRADAHQAGHDEPNGPYQIRHHPTIAFFTDPSGVRIELTEGLDEF